MRVSERLAYVGTMQRRNARRIFAGISFNFCKLRLATAAVSGVTECLAFLADEFGVMRDVAGDSVQQGRQ